MHDFQVCLDRLSGVCARILDRLALSGDTRQFWYEHAVAAFRLGHHHDIELTLRACGRHAVDALGVGTRRSSLGHDFEGTTSYASRPTPTLFKPLGRPARLKRRRTRHPYGMARADLLVHLVRAAKERDDGELGRTVESMIAEERGKQHHLLAERLENALHAGPLVGNGGAPPEVGAGFAVLTPRRALDELFLPESARAVVDELIEEQQRTETLRAYGLEPRHRVLLTGPPGNGKTSLGEAIAEALLLPLVVVRYEEVIGSYLGETAAQLAAVFNFARMRRCVLFFDEFDALAKERGDEHETGEIKRVVSSLLLQVDAIPSHVIVVGASNHPELLDRAVHRRFQLRLELPLPGKVARITWFERLLGELDEPAGMSAETLARRTTGASFSQLQDLTDDIRRRRVLEPGTSLRRLIGERLRQWREVTAPETHA